jgi:pimeloyl-ACP methyl ester carboxylesterase
MFRIEKSIYSCHCYILCTVENRLTMKPLYRLSGYGLLAFLSPFVGGAIAGAATLSSITCSETSLPVSLAPGETTQYQVYGQLCSPPGAANRSVQVLVSGNTYNRSYWDFSYPGYSYVNAITQAGFATFNIDRIGVGNSSRPPADQVTVQSNAYVLHQINQALRNGTVNGTAFNQIVNVGHSFGSITAIETASQYGGIDGVILTGFLHNINPTYVADATASLYPAQLDPHFSNQDLPEGYLTTIPGARSRLFHNAANADPQVIALDEATKDTLTTGEIATTGEAFFSNKSKQIKVPVLLAIGQKDYPFCTGNICNSAASVAAFESAFFSPEANLQTYILPNAGHDINLALNVGDWFHAARQWSARYIGPVSRPAESPPQSSAETDALKPVLRARAQTQSVPESPSVLGLAVVTILGIFARCHSLKAEKSAISSD